MKPSGLYIHIPYCRSKCLYCDFYSGGARTADWTLLVDCLLRELSLRGQELSEPPSTIYIGGGTPSLLPVESFRRLAQGIRGSFPDVMEIEEFTVEVNPEDVTIDKCRVWRECGVDRVSMGVQSFNDSELRNAGRSHDADTVRKAYGLLREYFDNVSVDLMFGLPGQTVDTWDDSVSEALMLHPEHISAYSLMFEPGTAMTILREGGRLSFPSEEDCVGMWDLLTFRLRENGYGQYEISNYSLPGRESVHNSRYWTQNPYLGIGPSAHSYDGFRVRRWNPSDLKGYLAYYRQVAPETAEGGSLYYNEEILSEEELKEEMLLTRMRTKTGLDVEEYGEIFGKGCTNRLLANAENEIRKGLLRLSKGKLRLTEKGVRLSDEVILSLSL